MDHSSSRRTAAANKARVTLSKSGPQDLNIKQKTGFIDLSPVVILAFQGLFCSRLRSYVTLFKPLINLTSWGSPFCTSNKQGTESSSDWAQMHSEKMEELGSKHGSVGSTPPWPAISRYLLMELVQGSGTLSCCPAAGI